MVVRPLSVGAGWSSCDLIEGQVGIIVWGAGGVWFVCGALDPVVAFESEEKVCVGGSEAALVPVEGASLHCGDFVQSDFFAHRF